MSSKCGAKRLQAQQEVMDFLWTLFPKEPSSLTEQKQVIKICDDKLRADLVKCKTALAQLREEHEHLQRRYDVQTEKLERWQEFFTSAIAAKKENAQLRREIVVLSEPYLEGQKQQEAAAEHAAKKQKEYGHER
jgi:septation ring formation regulator EzrA